MGPVIIANKTFPVSRSRAAELRTRTRTERHARSVRINLSHYLRLRYRRTQSVLGICLRLPQRRRASYGDSSPRREMLAPAIIAPGTSRKKSGLTSAMRNKRKRSARNFLRSCGVSVPGIRAARGTSTTAITGFSVMQRVINIPVLITASARPLSLFSPPLPYH